MHTSHKIFFQGFDFNVNVYDDGGIQFYILDKEGAGSGEMFYVWTGFFGFVDHYILCKGGYESRLRKELYAAIAEQRGGDKAVKALDHLHNVVFKGR